MTITITEPIPNIVVMPIIDLGVVTQVNVPTGLNIAVLSPGATQSIIQNALNWADVEQDVSVDF